MTVITLDLDGTLVDSRKDMVDSIHRVRAHLDLAPRPDDAVRPWVSRGMDNLYRHCFDDWLGAEPIAQRYAEVLTAYEADYLAHVIDSTRLYPGVAAVLPVLADSATLACVTNKPEHISRALLDALGVLPHFSAVIGGDTCVAPKPDPVMLQTAIDTTKGTGAVFHCGDSNGDMKMAGAFGATRVWCAWGYYDAIEQPFDRQMATPEDLAQLLA